MQTKANRFLAVPVTNPKMLERTAGPPAGRRLRRKNVLILVLAAAVILSVPQSCFSSDVIVIGGVGGASHVPAWDASGCGPLPRQAVACIDMTEDARFVAVGTIAPEGDPNVFLLDAEGHLLGQYEAGHRWIESVAVSDDGRTVAAVCTTPEGTSGDAPTLYVFGRDGPPHDAPQTQPRELAAALFHYGDHSNHLGLVLRAAAGQFVAAAGDQVTWLADDTAGRAQIGAGGRITAADVSPNGWAVVGCAARPETAPDRPHNVFLFQPGVSKPLWSRPISLDTDAPRPPEPGLYGPAAPPHHDEEIFAPLAVAVDSRAERIAVADYQGWERHFAARGIQRERSYGLRFMPSRPTVRVYDLEGKLLRRFGPEAFDRPFWCDLRFSADGKRLLAVPHRWTCRGLAGQTILPADAAANSFYVLDLTNGRSTTVRLADAISDLAQSKDGRIAVGCFDGRVYLLDQDCQPLPSASKGIPVGAPALVRVASDATRILAAGTHGVVRMLDAEGKLLWQTDLNRAATPGKKPWLARAGKAKELAPGVWRVGGGRTHSDMGAQYVVEAPEGLILIDPNAGLAQEAQWANMQAAGLDPMQVRYVLLTHEHGDHAPGAYLWRVLAGAKVVASAETAYTLGHHIPGGTGYGFHPPVPVDLALSEEAELELAGLPIRAVRLPGHTYGSMGWVFDQQGTTYAAIGDLIMPGGKLGYSGSINFSPQDVLDSLRKLARLDPDVILPGHGPYGDPVPYIPQGIAAGEATGWGKMQPPKPDPLFGFSRKNYLVVGWLEPIESAAFGDVDGDGKPDVALLTAAADGTAVKLFCNRGGSFDALPDCAVHLPQLDTGFKIRLGHLNEDRIADLMVSSESEALLLISEGGKPAYRIEPLPGVARAARFLPGDFNGDGRTDCLIGQRFVGGYQLAIQSEEGRFLPKRSPQSLRSYFDMELLQLGGDPKPDLLTSAGQAIIRQPDGSLSDTTALQLNLPGQQWTFLATGDFNGDGRPDVALLTKTEPNVTVTVHYHSGNPNRPFTEKPDATFPLPPGVGPVRDGPTVGDWNRDAVADVALCAEDRTAVVILLGSAPGGLDPQQTATVPLDFVAHHDTRLGLADFNGDGTTDVAAFGQSAVGAAGVYIQVQPAGEPHFGHPGGRGTALPCEGLSTAPELSPAIDDKPHAEQAAWDSEGGRFGDNAACHRMVTHRNVKSVFASVVHADWRIPNGRIVIILVPNRGGPA